jgi:hypothetical protein
MTIIPFYFILEADRKKNLSEKEKELLMELLVETLANDTTNDTQKMLNYVKKREIDTLRNKLFSAFI